MHPLIEISSLTKSFDATRAVSGVSFSADRGEVVGFLGPNGAGKTTTMRMIAGFLAPDSGFARIDGADVVAKPVAAKNRMGYLPEGAPLYGEMTAGAFLEFIAAARGLAKPSRGEAVGRVEARLALGPVMGKKIDTLSKGFRRRVGIAQAIIHDPPVLILDEPTDGLDPNQKHEMRTLINEMAAEKAIVISTHVLEEVDAVCTRAIIIESGRVRFDGTPASLRSRSDYHNAVVITLTDEVAKRAESPLRHSPLVERVLLLPLGGGSAELVVKPREGAGILGEVQAILAAASIVPQTIAVERGRLDEVFRTLTTDKREDGIDVGGETA